MTRSPRIASTPLPRCRPAGRVGLRAALCLCAWLVVLAGCSGSAGPAPGADFRGPIETGERAGAGTLEFTVSADGTSIEDLSIALTEVACDGLTLGETSDLYGGPVLPIESNGFAGSIPAVGTGGRSMSSDYSVDPAAFATFATVADLSTVGRLEGTFSSAEEAVGTITIHIWVIGTDLACELGTFPWSAAAAGS